MSECRHTTDIAGCNPHTPPLSSPDQVPLAHLPRQVTLRTPDSPLQSEPPGRGHTGTRPGERNRVPLSHCRTITHRISVEKVVRCTRHDGSVGSVQCHPESQCPCGPLRALPCRDCTLAHSGKVNRHVAAKSTGNAMEWLAVNRVSHWQCNTPEDGRIRWVNGWRGGSECRNAGATLQTDRSIGLPDCNQCTVLASHGWHSAWSCLGRTTQSRRPTSLARIRLAKRGRGGETPTVAYDMVWCGVLQ